jgi:hypothetical protein
MSPPFAAIGFKNFVSRASVRATAAALRKSLSAGSESPSKGQPSQRANSIEAAITFRTYSPYQNPKQSTISGRLTTEVLLH